MSDPLAQQFLISQGVQQQMAPLAAGFAAEAQFQRERQLREEEANRQVALTQARDAAQFGQRDKELTRHLEATQSLQNSHNQFTRQLEMERLTKQQEFLDAEKAKDERRKLEAKSAEYKIPSTGPDGKPRSTEDLYGQITDAEAGALQSAFERRDEMGSQFRSLLSQQDGAVRQKVNESIYANSGVRAALDKLDDSGVVTRHFLESARIPGSDPEKALEQAIAKASPSLWTKFKDSAFGSGIQNKQVSDVRQAVYQALIDGTKAAESYMPKETAAQMQDLSRSMASHDKMTDILVNQIHNPKSYEIAMNSLAQKKAVLGPPASMAPSGAGGQPGGGGFQVPSAPPLPGNPDTAAQQFGRRSADRVYNGQLLPDGTAKAYARPLDPSLNGGVFDLTPTAGGIPTSISAKQFVGGATSPSMDPYKLPREFTLLPQGAGGTNSPLQPGASQSFVVDGAANYGDPAFNSWPTGRAVMDAQSMIPPPPPYGLSEYLSDLYHIDPAAHQSVLRSIMR